MISFPGAGRGPGAASAIGRGVRHTLRAWAPAFAGELYCAFKQWRRHETRLG